MKELSKETFEGICELVHEAWREQKHKSGIFDHPDDIPYSDLTEEIKDYDRATAKTVIDAIVNNGIAMIDVKNAKNRMLAESAALMVSEDYKERFKAECMQLHNRIFGLAAMLAKWDKCELGFTPTCPREWYDEQFNRMVEYAAVLMKRDKKEEVGYFYPKSEVPRPAGEAVGTVAGPEGETSGTVASVAE